MKNDRINTVYIGYDPKERVAYDVLKFTIDRITNTPLIIRPIKKDVVENMKMGSVVVDLASENGGNCELTQKDEIINQERLL